MSNKIVIVGIGELGALAFEYFSHDSEFEIFGFAVEDTYYKETSYLSQPVIPLSLIESAFPPTSYKIFVAISASRMNHNRRRVYELLKLKGYSFATYVSSKAFVWRNSEIGENCFIFENNVIQPFTKVGNNCILWSGNHIGHRTTVGDHVFISSHVVISGYCIVGNNSYFGVNSTVHNNINIAEETLVGAGAMITKDTISGHVYVGSPAKPVPGKASIDVQF